MLDRRSLLRGGLRDWRCWVVGDLPIPMRKITTASDRKSGGGPDYYTIVSWLDGIGAPPRRAGLCPPPPPPHPQPHPSPHSEPQRPCAPLKRCCSAVGAIGLGTLRAGSDPTKGGVFLSLALLRVRRLGHGL